MPIHSEILAVMLVDMVSYTKTTSRLKRESFSRLHDIFDDIALPIFSKYGGHLIKKIGDAFLVSFRSATDSLLCGMEIQNAFFDYNKKYKPIPPIRVRIAVHLGEIIYRNEDIFGEAVNITARIEEITKPGDIVFTDAVYLAMNKNEVPYVHVGLRKFRGIKYPLRLFLVKRNKVSEPY